MHAKRFGHARVLTVHLRGPRALILGAAAILASLVIGVGFAGALAPTVTVEAASEIGVTSALAKGTVNPEEKETNCHFDYIADAQFGQNPAEPFEGAAQAPCTGNPLTGNTAQPVEAELTGLVPATVYHLRLVAENVEAESSNEPAPTFATDPATAPTVAVTGSSGVKYTFAKLEGTINPNGGNQNPIEGTLPIQWFLQYAPAAEAEPRNWQNANLTSTNFPIEGAAAASSSPIPLEAEPVGLQPATEYAFRTVAFYAGGIEAVSPTDGSFTTLTVAKPVVTISTPGTPTASTVQLSGEVNPNSPEPEASTSPAEKAAYKTEWHFECVGPHPCGIPTGTAIEADDTAHPVSAEAKGLEPNTTYTVVLVAGNLGGTSDATEIAGQPVTFTTSEVEPEVTLTPLIGPVAESVTLRASVNPHNSPVTRCAFDWGTREGYGQVAPCEPSPTGNEYTLVAGHLTGLSLGTEYHYKVVLQTAGGSAETLDTTFATVASEAQSSCPNEARRVEQHSTFLPDCRAYEMASPSDKNGADVIGVPQRTRAAADGAAVDFASLVGFGDARGSGISFDYLAERTAEPGTSGWSTHAITPGPLNPVPFATHLDVGGLDPIYQGALSENLERGAFLSVGTPLTPGSSPTEKYVEGGTNLYTRDDLLSPGPGEYRLDTDCPACTETSPPIPLEAVPAFAGASTDFSHLIFESTTDLTADSQSLSSEQTKLYESHQGSVTLAGQIPPPGATECGPAPLPACEPAPSSQAGQGALFNSNVTTAPARYAPNAISRDGSRIYFTVPASGSGGSAGPLYLRTDNGTPQATTARVDVLEPGDTPSPAGDAKFWTATSDGSKVFFTTKQNLIPSDTSSENTTDLYMYDVEALPGLRLTRISTPDEGPGLGADVKGVLGASDDGSYVYFASSTQLLAGQPPQRANNVIFVWHNGVVHFIAAVATAELGLIGEAAWNLAPLSSRVSTDGSSLLFTGVAAGAELPHSGVGDLCANTCSEVYLYDAAAGDGQGALTCVSCRPGDLQAPAETDASFLSGVGRGVASLTNYLNHPLSADGGEVFFTTGDRLRPEDTDNAADVYEYDTRTGQLHLISSGTDPGGSYFMDASADGSNVFFVTRQRLLGWDTDGAYDLYDARVDGGFAEPAAEVAECGGAGCRPGPAGPPGAAGAGTATFNGAANPKSKCKKGQVKKQGKCVKKQQKNSKKKNRNKKGKSNKKSSAKGNKQKNKRTDDNRGGAK